MIKRVTAPRFRQAWSVIRTGLSVKTATDYKKAVALLDDLLDEIGDNESHPLFGFLKVLSAVIESYETAHIGVGTSSPQDVLKLLMEQHDLTQSDLPEVGSQGVVSEILNGKRSLNARQIKLLCVRFRVSPKVFF